MGFGTYVEATLKFVIYGLLPSFFSLFLFVLIPSFVWFTFLFYFVDLTYLMENLWNGIIVTRK